MIANEGLLYFVYIIRGWIKLICRLGLSSSTDKLVCRFISPSVPLEVGHLFKIQLGDPGSAVSSPSAEIEFGAIRLVLKSATW